MCEIHVKKTWTPHVARFQPEAFELAHSAETSNEDPTPYVVYK